MTGERTGRNPNANNLKHRRSYGKCFFAMIGLISIMMAGMIVWRPLVRAYDTLPPIALTVVALNGTQVVLHENGIGSLASYRAYGGLVNQVGTLENLGNYTGVPLINLCNLVGGLGNGSSLLITASDNYTTTLSYAQVNGNWTTYNNETGQPAPQTQPLTPILAYFFNDANLSSTQGPLQLAIVGPEGLLTDGRFWVHSVVNIEIQSTSVPEFSASFLILVFTMIAAIMAALVFRKKIRNLQRERALR